MTFDLMFGSRDSEGEDSEGIRNAFITLTWDNIIMNRERMC